MTSNIPDKHSTLANEWTGVVNAENLTLLLALFFALSQKWSHIGHSIAKGMVRDS